MDTSITQQRFKEVREQLQLTQAAFGKHLGLSSSTADIERGRTKISGEVTMLLLKDYHINPLWLFGHSNKKLLNPSSVDTMPKAITVDQDGHENIVMVPAKAAAGYGNNIGDSTYMNRLPAFSFPLPEYRNASFRGFQISGDSMTPLVNSGDWVLAKAVASFQEVVDNQVYIIVESDSIRLKKLQKQEQGKVLNLISLNPEYAPTATASENILELWEYHSKISFGIEKIQGLTLEKVYDEVKEIKAKVERL
ncbi:MAG: DNA-binding protein [Flavobacteriaceae bacterium]|nr:DNA-binding protein [Flavobacteriaceae bacterium]